MSRAGTRFRTHRIFGFDGWNRETVESRCVLARENRGTFLAVYIADWISRFPRLLMCSGPLILNHLFNVATFFLTPSASASLRASSMSGARHKTNIDDLVKEMVAVWLSWLNGTGRL